tara:strand:+ start:25 stop:282 length:258 start_codon:yes stop_codon:yes gene_type:complete
MSEKKEKNYLASSIKKVETKFGGLLNCSMKKDDLDAIEKNGWINFTIAERKEVSEKGATHYAFENTYEPKQKDKPKDNPQDDLPF